MKSRLLFVVLLAVAVLVPASAAFAAPTAKEELPFKGSLEAVETYMIEFPIMDVEADGSGNATHLGRYEAHYEAQVDLAAGGTSVVEISFVAANGDILDAEGTGLGVPSGTPDEFQVTEDYAITGGTGRFVDATGNFTVTRLVNTATGATSGSFDGNIVLH